MQLICVDCGVPPVTKTPGPEPAENAPITTEDNAIDNATLCTKCAKPLQLPTVFDCARLGLLDELKQLIDETPEFDVNALEPASNATLLHHAAVNSKMRILEFLFSDPVLKRAITIDALGGDLQTTPLFWAAYHNHIYAIEVLLRHGADAGFMDAAGFNAFLLAIQRCFPITAAYLVAKGTDIDVRMQDDLQRTALMLLSARERFHLDSFRMVLSLNASVDLQDAQGNTALHYAAKNDVGLAVRMLLDFGADPTLVNAAGETPLSLALQFAHPKSATRHLLTEDAQLQSLARWTGISKRSLEANVYKLSFFVPWLYLGAAGVIVTHSSGAITIAWQQALLLALTVALLQLLQRGSYGDKQKAAALMFGVNLSSIVYIAASFPRVAAGAHVGVVYQIVTTLSVVLTLACLYWTVIADAGVVATSYAEKLTNIRELVEAKSPVATKLCLTCLHRRPLRSKHCPELRACIAKFDHYCPFTVNAIGAGNHRAFVGFVAFAELGIALVLVAIWRFLALHPQVVWRHGVLAWLHSVAHYEPVLAGVAVLGVVHAAWIGYLLGFHAYLAATARTTYEFIKNEGDARAFSRGSAWHNAVEFFGLPQGGWGRAPRAVDWRRVFSVADFEAVSDGGSKKSKAL